MRMLFKELFIFSPSEKIAKKIDFSDGVNIITSSQEDGTDRGKSVIMRSLYHTMGAEACFETKWDDKSKVYILKIEIDGVEYYMYRATKLFKFFDSKKKLLFNVVKSSELSKELKQYTEFAVMLPNRNDTLEITPPAFNYLPFFVDQDHYEGNKYQSFNQLGQYKNFRESVLYYHLGAYDEKYFDLVSKQEEINKKREKNKHQEEMFNIILDRIGVINEGLPFSSEYETLQNDVALYQKQYAEVLDEMNKSKSKLIKLRNELYKKQSMLKDIKDFSRKTEKKIKKLHNHICPECGSEISDAIYLKSKNYNLIDSAVLIKNDLQISLCEYENKIEEEEKIYVELLEQMKRYEQKLQINTERVKNVLKQKGLSEVRDQIVFEKMNLSDELNNNKIELQKIKDSLDEYKEKKKNIEEQYCSYMIEARNYFKLHELLTDNFKKLTSSVKASGSNKNIVTIIWYITILELRKQFNKDAIEFPVVFDSPNNVEIDNQKKSLLTNYIIDKCGSGQLIISLLGYSEINISKDKEINVIVLQNDKYHLLDSDSYELYKDLLEELNGAV